jgi:enoyl-CoA hydratase/carnithine racemase
MTSSSAHSVLRTAPRPGVVQLTLSRPERLNALTHPLVVELRAHVSQLREDRDCRVVVLTGAGRGFCSGLDLDGYGAVAGTEDFGPTHRWWAAQRELAAVMQELHRLPQPVIAAVNGPAAGGGLGLVCASDIRLASSKAVFSTSFIRIGASGCDVGTSWLLPRLVGAGRAHELIMTSRRFDAAEARAIGLVADVVPPDDLAARVDATADDLLRAPPLAMTLTKQAMWLSMEIPSLDAAIELENRQQVLSLVTTDADEAMASYRGGYQPRYRNT